MPCAGRKRHTDVMEAPLVSIIIPIYNSEKFLEAALTSVQNQTYSNWELILIDDASTDSSAQVAREFYLEDQRITYERLPENQGTAVCRNRGIAMAKGDFIAFLDSDDFWLPDKLELQVDFMQRHDCDVSYTNYLLIDEEGNSLHRRVVAMPKLSYKKQMRNNYIGNLTGMYRSKTIGKVFSPKLRKRQDWGLWLEAIKRSGKPALGIQVDLAFYRKRRDSISTDKVSLVKYNFLFYRNHLDQSLPQSIWSLGRFFFEYFFVRPRYIQRT